jgi:outer membrane receptor protein involved in Fe transport
VAFASNTLPNPTIQPETSMGYDLGFDARMGDGQTVMEGDIFRTNLFNQFLSATYGNGVTGLLCPSTGGFVPNGAGTQCVGTGGATAPYISVPLYTTQNINLGDARYDGIEFSVKRDPLLGFGFDATMTLLHAYDFNISPCLYSKVPGCTNPLVNLAVVNGSNFIGSPEGGNLAAGVSIGSVQNHAIPYSQAYAEMHVRFPGNGLLSLNGQYYGNNNSLNLPAFTVASATARIGIGDRANSTLQLTVYNIFGVYSNGYSTYSGGVTYPLANGQQALSAANSIGPPEFTVVLSHKF